jgi:hypothetical protein
MLLNNMRVLVQYWSQNEQIASRFVKTEGQRRRYCKEPPERDDQRGTDSLLYGGINGEKFGRACGFLNIRSQNNPDFRERYSHKNDLVRVVSLGTVTAQYHSFA